MLLAVSMAFLVLSACASSDGDADNAGSAPLIHLPADNAMHPAADSEWWYFVGHVSDSSHHRFGFETTLFKFRHLQIPGSKETISIDKADVALTDVHGNSFAKSVTYFGPGLGIINLATKHFSEQLGADRVWSSGKYIQVYSNTASVALRLRLLPIRQVMLEGGKGIVPMGSQGYSYYYSYPKLSVGGKIRYQGQWRTVSGVAWMDHQWGNWKWTNIKGWTWGAIQLNNGVDFSISDFRARGKSAPRFDGFVPGGESEDVLDCAHQSQRLLVQRRHQSEVWFPWSVSIPGLDARLFVRPLVKDQLVFDSTEPAASYWEGDCSVTGTFKGRPVRGQAYMESSVARETSQCSDHDGFVIEPKAFSIRSAYRLCVSA